MENIIYQPIIILDEEISYGYCPECSERLSANLIENQQSIEIVKRILMDLSPEQDVIIELKNGTLIAFLCDKCDCGIRLLD